MRKLRSQTTFKLQYTYTDMKNENNVANVDALGSYYFLRETGSYIENLYTTYEGAYKAHFDNKPELINFLRTTVLPSKEVWNGDTPDQIMIYVHTLDNEDRKREVDQFHL